MRVATLTAVILMCGTMGWAMEVAHPVFFAQEPVVVWTSPSEGRPTLLFCGDQVIPAWKMSAEGERVRWKATLPQTAPLGVWSVTDQDKCYSFLRIPMDWAILEVVGVPGAQLEAPGTYVIPEDGATLLVGSSGSWRVSITFPGWKKPKVKEISLPPGERKRLLLGWVKLTPSTPVALPGSEVTLTAHILTPVEISTLAHALRLPPGWSAEPTRPSCLEEAIPSGRLATRAWLIHLPPEARGNYTIEVILPDIRLRGTVNIKVGNHLPIGVVVTHWDLKRSTLDLTLPGKITYERILWAASLVGKEVPFTGQHMTRAKLEALVEKWRSGTP